MKLGDVMSAMGLATYAEVALLIFLLVFVAVAIDVLRPGRRKEALAALPLADDAEPSPSRKTEGAER
jgi:cbb3-type cytochrome oxidase subunit 3